jgi:fructoselysine-6-P-deglycase FrlB-like protein
MSYVAAEIATQPENWRTAAELARANDVAGALPSDGERVAVVGCGTSHYIAQSCAALREARGLGETDAFAASQFPAGRSYDRVVAITRSGTTTEVIRLLESLTGHVPTTVVTTSDTVPVAAIADRVIVFDFADEQSVVQTRFATSMLALWRAHLGEDLGAVVDEAALELRRELPAAAVSARQFTFLGDGWTVGLAEEAALKLREAAQAWTEAYPAMEFRHGPISVIDDESVVWFFGPPPPGLVDELASSGALVVQSDIDAMALLTSAQRLAVAVAERKGLDPDQPRNLTRSIVLSG